MEKKENILTKLNIKDYNNSLEKILEKKKFSLDTKNLLLSMLYKIENGYADYAKTKVLVPSKNDFIENIFNILKEECEEIIVAEFNSEASNILKKENVKFIIQEDEKKIIVFGNELLLLDCILSMKEQEICLPEEKQVLQVPISNLLNLGSRMNQVEVVRDFNGWSWDIVIKEITNIDINIIYQNVLYLMGYKFIKQWRENNTCLADYLELLQDYLQENFGEKRTSKFVNLFCKLAIDIENNKNDEQHRFWKEKKESLEVELNKLQNKKKFLEQKTQEKKKYTKEIEEIDKMLNNKELLKREYTKRNEKLPNKEKIFSISHLVDRLNNERDELLQKIKQCNKLIEPKGYIERKNEVEKKVIFLENLDIGQKQDRRKVIIELCNIFLECFRIKITKAKTKQEIVEYIYELRYYGLLPIDEKGSKLKDVLDLKTELDKTRQILLEKARKLDVIDMITEDEEINEKILNNIFDSKMIELNHMIIETRVTDGKLYVEYYDEKVLENVVEVESDRTVRLKKKTKLFV